MQQHGIGALPRHVGIIPDGNRRWAHDRNLDSRWGHQRGVAKILEVLAWCSEVRIKVVSLYLLSVGNLTRAPSEALTVFVEDLLGRMTKAQDFRLRLIGAVELLPASTREAIEAATVGTTDNHGPLVNLALAYNGRDDIVNGLRAALRSPALRDMPAEQIAELLTPEMIDQHISTQGQPNLDLIIRTSGEHRLSGFLTWQAEQSELYFCARQWPDFTKDDFLAALNSYANRQRRHGR